MQVSQTYDLSALFGHPPGTNVFATSPQAPGSDTSILYENLYADLGIGTSIEFLGEGTVSVMINPNGGAAGYAPFDPVVSDPLFPPVGVTPNANYGLTIGAPLELELVQHELIGTLVGPARPIVGNKFSFIPGADVYLGTGGRTAVSSSLFTNSSSMVDFPLAAFGTSGSTEGSWAPWDLTAGPWGTLMIPIESRFTSIVQTEVSPGFFVDIPVELSASGQIFFTLIPEPPSMLLLGCGLVSLLSCRRWRRRLVKWRA